MLIIELTPEQIQQLAPAYARIGKMADDGKPGMLVAQIYYDHMRVGIMSNEASKKIQDALKTQESARKNHRSAYELQRLNEGKP